MQEWTDPRYAPVVDALMTMRAASRNESDPRRCRACFGFRGRMVIAPGGQRHLLGCTRCGGSGLQPLRPRRRR
jgi:hypothetical protein